MDVYSWMDGQRSRQKSRSGWKDGKIEMEGQRWMKAQRLTSGLMEGQMYREIERERDRKRDPGTCLCCECISTLIVRLIVLCTV